MVEQPPKEECGIEFDLDSAQAANEAAEAAAQEYTKGSTKESAAKEPAVKKFSAKETAAKKSAEKSAPTPKDASSPSSESIASAESAPAADEKPSAVAKFFADDGMFMRIVWWTLRTTASFVVPIGIFYVLERCDSLVNNAYKMLSPGVSPYPALMKGDLAQILAMLIISVPAFFGMWIGAILAKFKSLKPIIAVAIWCLIMFPVTLFFVVVAKYFHII